jgi:hypothetical protein
MIETRLINKRFVSVMGECVIWTSQVRRENRRITNSLCNLPDVLSIVDIKEITLGDCYYNQNDIF